MRHRPWIRTRTFVLFLLAAAPVAVLARQDLTDTQYEELAGALDMSVEDLQVLLEGLTEPIVDLEAGIELDAGTTLGVGAQNVMDTYSAGHRAARFGGREIHRVHVVGIQRRVLLRARRVRLGPLTRIPCTRKLWI